MLDLRGDYGYDYSAAKLLGRTMLMPFGMYKGQRIDEIPDDYLLWLCTVPLLREPLLSAVKLVMAQRQEEVRRNSEAAAVYCDRVRKIYLNMAKKWHPDVGGTTQAMQAINEFYDELMNP